MAARQISGMKKKPKFGAKSEKVAVLVDSVMNANIPIQINTTGQLTAKEKIALFSEVQGIMERGSNKFFEGTYFKKGSVLLGINSEEFTASLKAQRSNFYNQIIAIMPDLQLDYPESVFEWTKYLEGFDVSRTLAPLPEAGSEQEKYYIAGKQIYSTYYSIKNLEVKLSKHKIRAPFSGVLTEANVKEGTLIRMGQKLGEFVAPGIFELEVPVNASMKNLVKPGKKVKSHDIEGNRSWEGVITRINSKIDPTTQSISVFIELRANDLYEGMFLEAELDAREINNAFEINRKILNDDNSVFIVQDSVLAKVFVEPLYYKESSVIVGNLPDESTILANPVPGAYNGMKVEILN